MRYTYSIESSNSHSIESSNSHSIESSNAAQLEQLPVFRLTSDHDLEHPLLGVSPSDVCLQAAKLVAAKSDPVIKSPARIDGDRRFGLSHVAVRRLLQSLPQADRCALYKPLPDEEEKKEEKEGEEKEEEEEEEEEEPVAKKRKSKRKAVVASATAEERREKREGKEKEMKRKSDEREAKNAAKLLKQEQAAAARLEKSATLSSSAPPAPPERAALAGWLAKAEPRSSVAAPVTVVVVPPVISMRTPAALLEVLIREQRCASPEGEEESLLSRLRGCRRESVTLRGSVKTFGHWDDEYRPVFSLVCPASSVFASRALGRHPCRPLPGVDYDHLSDDEWEGWDAEQGTFLLSFTD